MNDSGQPTVPSPQSPAPASGPLPAPISRKQEVEAKQELVAGLIADASADGLLVLDPANIAWLCGSALTHGLADPAEWPALFFLPNQRYLICANADTQRLFDLFLDGLGFQLKEWPWHWGRDRLLADLVANRKVAADRVVTDCLPVAPALRRIRCTLTTSERSRMRDLGAKLVHAVEATGRTLTQAQSEAEIAGHLAHRLIRHGLVPVQLTVAADGRLARHRRPGVTATLVERTCTIAATASAGGLHATVARTVCFGPAPEKLRVAHDVACRVLAAQAAAARPGVPAPQALEAGRRVAHHGNREHEWRLTSPGWVTGWLPVERPVLPTANYPLGDDWAAVWQAGVGEALCADTFLIGNPPGCVTPVELWPAKRIVVGGASFDVADLLDE